MKIATWNLERPTKNGHKTPGIIDCLNKINADILVLTETNECIVLDKEYEIFHTEIFAGQFYKPGDRQVSIFSIYPIIKQLPTSSPNTSVCVEINTPTGKLIVYGTVIGNLGNKGDQFKNDIAMQLTDIKTIGKTNNCCVTGDFNISFSDNHYFTVEGRTKLKTAFELLEMEILTEQFQKNIDHIVLTKTYFKNRPYKIGYWNNTENKQDRLSDHKGVYVEILG